MFLGLQGLGKDVLTLKIVLQNKGNSVGVYIRKATQWSAVHFVLSIQNSSIPDRG